jgi:hypothetical protein
MIGSANHQERRNGQGGKVPLRQIYPAGPSDDPRHDGRHSRSHSNGRRGAGAGSEKNDSLRALSPLADRPTGDLPEPPSDETNVEADLSVGVVRRLLGLEQEIDSEGCPPSHPKPAREIAVPIALPATAAAVGEDHQPSRWLRITARHPKVAGKMQGGTTPG